MAALKKDLDEYLLRSESSSSVKIELPSFKFNVSNVAKPSTWFSKSTEEEGKIEEITADWCPSLVMTNKIFSILYI